MEANELKHSARNILIVASLASAFYWAQNRYYDRANAEIIAVLSTEIGELPTHGLGEPTLAQRVINHGGPVGVARSFVTDLAAGEVVASFNSQLAEDGWRVGDERSIDNTQKTIRFCKANRRITLATYQSGNRTGFEVFLHRAEQGTPPCH